MEKVKVLNSLKSLYNEIDSAIGHLVSSRINKNDEEEKKSISEMESLMVQSQQELDFLYDYINENIKC